MDPPGGPYLTVREISARCSGFTSPLGLWNSDNGQVGYWTFHVHKAALVLAKACGLLEQNGMSFVMEREGAR